MPDLNKAVDRSTSSLRSLKEKTRTEKTREDETRANACASELLPHWPAWEEIIVALGVEIDDLNWCAQHGRVAQWLANGWDLNLDIVPTVKRLAAKRKNIRRLEFFEGAIARRLCVENRPSADRNPGDTQWKT